MNETKQLPAPSSKFRFGILTLLLLISAVASWTAYWQASKQEILAREKVNQIREQFGELVVEDPNKFSHQELPTRFRGDLRYQIHVPPTKGDEQFRLCLASALKENTGPITPPEPQIFNVPLEPGRHVVALELIASPDPQANVLVDNKVVKDILEYIPANPPNATVFQMPGDNWPLWRSVEVEGFAPGEQKHFLFWVTKTKKQN